MESNQRCRSFEFSVAGGDPGQILFDQLHELRVREDLVPVLLPLNVMLLLGFLQASEVDICDVVVVGNAIVVTVVRVGTKTTIVGIAITIVVVVMVGFF